MESSESTGLGLRQRQSWGNIRLPFGICRGAEQTGGQELLCHGGLPLLVWLLFPCRMRGDGEDSLRRWPLENSRTDTVRHVDPPLCSRDRKSTRLNSSH